MQKIKKNIDKLKSVGITPAQASDQAEHKLVK